MKRFSRNRIQGISFHIQRSGVGLRRATSQGLSGPLDLMAEGRQSTAGSVHGESELQKAALAGKPQPLSRTDIRRLLADFGRQELHTLVSDAIESAVRWKHVADAAERLVANDGSDARVNHEEDVCALVETRTTLRLWRHRIEMLEWIADAQRSLQTLGRTQQHARKPQR